MEATTYPLTFTDMIWTYQDYRELPEDGKRYQVIGGVLYMTPAPFTDHQSASRNFEFLLWSYVKKHDLGVVYYAPIDVVLSQTDIVQPDVVFVSKGKFNLIQKAGIFGPPDLVVEIISPSTKRIDESSKKGLYEKYAVYEYVILYPDEKKVVQYCLERGAYQLVGTYTSSNVLPLKALPLEIDLREIF